MAERLGLGVLAFDGSSLGVRLAAQRQDPSPEKRAALYRELLRHSLRRTPGPQINYAVVGL